MLVRIKEEAVNKNSNLDEGLRRSDIMTKLEHQKEYSLHEKLHQTGRTADPSLLI
jgi:hypothetical protein